MQRFRIHWALVFAVSISVSTVVRATPYASGVTKSGTTVSFILNEPSDTLKYSINGGALQTLDGSTKGTKTFNLTSPSDKFSIVAEKNSAVGYTIPTGATVDPIFNTPGDYTTLTTLSQSSPQAGYAVISDDASLLSRYNSPRGVGVNRNPNTANFGTVYIANSAANSVGGRTLGDGLYAVRADESDAFGYGDTAQNPPLPDTFPAFSGASSNSPYRVFVANDGQVYVADWADVNANAFMVSPDLTSATNLLDGFNGTTGTATGDGTSLPPTQNHGSVAALYVEGSLSGGNMVLYTLDEDLTSAHVSGVPADPQNDRNSLWKYTVGAGPAPYSAMPTKVASGLLGTITTGGVLVDLDRGADGKFYMSEARTAGNEVGLIVTDPNGVTLFNSLEASRTLLNDPAAHDILTTLNQIAISPDQKYLAGMLNYSDVLILPLVNGIPDLTGRMVVNTAVHVNSGRDISFDAAGNIHYVSSGQGYYRALSPGGHTIATTAWDGTQYTFGVTAPPAGVAGDYNGNGVVDAADYVVWRNGGPLLNEGASIGVTDSADYDFWRAHFGATSGSGSSLGGAAVPEPCSVGIVMVGLTLAVAIRRRG